MKEYHIPNGKYCFSPHYTPCTDDRQVYKITHCLYWSLRSDNGIKGHCSYINKSDTDTVRFQEKICGKKL